MTTKVGHVSRSQHFNNVGRTGHRSHRPPEAAAKTEHQFNQHLEQLNHQTLLSKSRARLQEKLSLKAHKQHPTHLVQAKSSSLSESLQQITKKVHKMSLNTLTATALIFEIDPELYILILLLERKIITCESFSK